MGGIEALASGKPDETVVESLQASSHRLLQRIENLLDLCAVSGRFELEAKPASVPAAVVTGLSQLASVIKRKQTTIKLAPLPTSCPFEALIDVKRCGIAMLKLF